ncbi:Histone-lysine N-methyltransferase ASHR1 [Acorus calamus]|uniref:Histone-lysine N-methyltransferase ASHR1 n=1 Tax=Acorus calamus TaxID=4465 RepID=A0AAV9DLI6_ACOCL|nr:Histone-lysine N-methyltransferase ASHR1 [Acorus calamus]
MEEEPKNSSYMEPLRRAIEAQGLTVTTQQGKGRCLTTTVDFSPGQVIISQEPYASAPSNGTINSFCDGCFASGGLKFCSKCRVARYCGSGCQKLEWKLHQLECEALVGLSKDRREMLTTSIRLMVRLLLRRRLQYEKVIPTTATDNYELVEALEAHMSELNEEQLVLYAQMANLVRLVLPSTEIDVKNITMNFSRLACNAHSICDSELRPLGTGLYPVISIINHSCLPNSVLTFEGKLAVVRAVEPIPKGTEVLISYIETAGSSMTRKETLRKQYFFTCTCPGCMKVDAYADLRETAILEGYRCKDNKCDGFLFFNSDDRVFICQQCGLFRDEQEIKQIESEAEQLSSFAAKLLSSGEDNIKASTLYKTIEKRQINLCHSLSVKLLRTRESLLKIMIDLNDWREALSCCRLILPVYKRVYRKIHPMLGLQYYTCGKLEWFLEDAENALKSLTKAVDILRITHGSNTSFMRDLFNLLDEVRAEATHRLSVND